MKKSFILAVLFCLFVSLPSVYAESWDDFNDLDTLWDGQKSITNKDFEEVMDALQSNQKQKEAKQRKKKIKKISGGGTSLHQELNPDKEIVEMGVLKPDENTVNIINIPVDLVLDNDVLLEKGFYKVLARRDENKKIILMFYQSQYFKGQVEAIETKDDYDEKTIDFAKILPHNHSYMKLIYGSIDFNAYVYIPYITDKI